jgi:hypothetical protein
MKRKLQRQEAAAARRSSGQLVEQQQEQQLPLQHFSVPPLQQPAAQGSPSFAAVFGSNMVAGFAISLAFMAVMMLARAVGMEGTGQGPQLHWQPLEEEELQQLQQAELR